MPTYHEIILPKMKVYLTSGELAYLLQKDTEIFQRGLERGKAFKRAESKQIQYERKLAQEESEFLNKFL